VIIETPQLLLRPHELADVPLMVRLNADPDVVRYTGDVAFTSPAEAETIVASLQRQQAAYKMSRLVAFERETGAFVGWCGLRWHPEEGVADLGYRLLKECWGRGYATEAGAACVRVGFEELGLPRIIGRVVPENVGSVGVLRKLGFTRVGETACGDMPADLYERWPQPGS
jgi:ribosomal-protein-alanine N-acetyltransferase